MVTNAADALVESLRELNLLRPEQFNQLANEIAPKIEDTQELAKHLIKLGWITVYQAKKLLLGQGADLVLGHYVVLEKLGEGGMGKVYKAKQLRLSRTVALKVILPNLIQNEMALKRFQREAKAAAQLAHPNIVRLFDADQVNDRHFLAMEYVDGTDLAKLIKESGPLSVGMACSFIRQAATGLQHAHDLGLVHRDIKPSNLLVSAPAKSGKNETGGIIKILDMGLARATVQDDVSGASALTQDGTVIGTPDFMSPEQGKNSSLVDGRSDLYSLGCTLYYLLTGQTPFPEGGAIEKLIQHQVDQPPSVQSLRPDVPNELAAIVHKLLAKKPEDRIQSGGALALALEPWSVFDTKNEILKTSGKLARPANTLAAMAQAAAPAVLPNETAPPAPGPFDFDEQEPEPAAAPRKPTPPPQPVPFKKKSLAPEKTEKKRRLWLMLGIAGGIILLAGGLLLATGIFHKGDRQKKEDAKDGAAEKSLASEGKKLDPRALDSYLPTDTEAVAVLSVQQLNSSRFFQQNLYPQLKDLIAQIKSGAHIDLFKAVDRVIIAVPGGHWNQTVVIVQGADIVNPSLLNWAAKIPGASVTSERIPGQSGTKEVYCLPSQKEKAAGAREVTFGAVLSSSPGALVLSSSKERVIETLARAAKNLPATFSDPGIRPMLAKYPSKDVAMLWMGISGESKMVSANPGKKNEKGLSKDAGVSYVISTLRLRENNTMTVEMNFEAKSKAIAEAGFERLKGFVVAAALANKGDSRLNRLEELVKSAKHVALNAAMKRDNPNVHQWWCSISSDALPDWFAPFVAVARN